MTLFSLDLPGIPKLLSGKVREVFDLGPDGLLLVATDRLSAFDCVLPDPIPSKGAVLNGLSAYWFSRLRELRADAVPSHFLTDDAREFPAALRPFDAQLRGRSMWVRRAEPLPVECVVRGYIAGSGWKEYQSASTIGGHALPGGLRVGDRLPEPLFTPATKATSGHDENITWEQFVQHLGGDQTLASALRRASQNIYELGSRHAAERGIIIADTKFEFGIDPATGDLLLIDECMTPDSSRFWPADQWRPGVNPPSYDKQYVRDYLESSHWDKTPPAPSLPNEVIARTTEKYKAAFELLTGRQINESS